MVIRRFEEESARNYAKGKIGGFLHLYIGQEAIAVAAAEVLEDRDYIFQTYRDHGIALARGMSADAAMAELFGKDTGCRAAAPLVRAPRRPSTPPSPPTWC